MYCNTLTDCNRRESRLIRGGKSSAMEVEKNKDNRMKGWKEKDKKKLNHHYYNLHLTPGGEKKKRSKNTLDAARLKQSPATPQDATNLLICKYEPWPF